MTIKVRVAPQGAVLNEYYRCRAPRHFIRGPMGSAKTSTSFWKLFDLAREQAPNAQGVRPSSWYIVRNTYTDLVGTTIADWKRTFDQRGVGSVLMNPLPHHDMKYRMEDGSIVDASYTFIGLDRPEDVRRVMGGNLSGVFINECRYAPFSIIEDLGSRVWRYPSMGLGGVECTWGGIFGDTNSPSDEHWFYQKAEVERPNGWEFFTQPPALVKRGGKWEINPKAENLANLHPNYYLDMLGNDNDWIRVNLGNEYGHFHEGQSVYGTDFKDSTHVAEFELDPNLPLLLGWDFGLTPACIIGQLSSRGQLRIRHELCATRMGITRFARDVVKPFLGSLKRKLGEECHIGCSWADPAGTSSHETDERASIGILNDAYVDDGEHDDKPLNMGFFTEPANTNVPTRRIAAVGHYLRGMIDGAPAFLLHKDCTKLRQGFNGKYCYRKMRIIGPERFHDTPDKNEWSHPHDALQYLALAAQGGYVTERLEPEYEEVRSERSKITGY